MLTILLGPDDLSKRTFAADLAAKKKTTLQYHSAPDLPAPSSLSGGDLFGMSPLPVLVGALSAGTYTLTDWTTLAESDAAIYVIEASVDRRKELPKKVLALKGVSPVDFPLPHGRDLDRWIITRAVALGVSIEPTAVEALAVAVGRDQAEEIRAGGTVVSVTEHFDLYQVSSELEKLAAYARGRSITAQDVAELTNKTVSGDPFGIMDAVSAKNRGAVFSAVDRFLGSGQDEKGSCIQLVSLLAEQLRGISVVQGMDAARSSDDAILSATGWKSGRLFMVRKNARTLDPRRVLPALERLASLELELKSGLVPPRPLLALTLAQLVG